MTGLSRGDADRSAYLDEVCRLLWPPPAAAVRSRAGSGDLVVLPSLRDPRLLVPARRRAGAAALRRYGEPGSVRARLGRRALELALASGAGPVLLRDRLRIRIPAGTLSLETYLSRHLGTEVLLSVHLGAPRANRKPVLQLLTPDGRTIAYAKLGITPLTSRLVRAERAALDQVAAARLTTVTAPRVRHLGRWQDLDVLILSALPVWQPRRPLAGGQLAAAMAEVAGLAREPVRPLADGGYLDTLTARLAAAPASADRAALESELTELARQHGRSELALGGWHGDWTPWNMACTADGLLVWDWERFATGVPAGFDALHYQLQSDVVAGRADPAAAAGRLTERAPALLAPLEIGPDAARLTALLYLAELSARYLADRQAEAGARLGAPGQWLIPALAAGRTRELVR
jgi:Phosphotransferase enzyme family